MTITPNPTSAHLRHSSAPVIDATAFVHPQAFVCGDVTLGPEVFVAPFASVRGDEGSPFHIGACSNVQDGVVLHGLETFHENGNEIENHLVKAGDKNYSIFIGERVSLAHQSQVHGPAYIGNDTFVGMQAFVFKSRVGNGCVIEPGAKVMGVQIADRRYIPAGAIINSQAQADELPQITDKYPLAHLNEAVVKVNRELARNYRKANS